MVTTLNISQQQHKFDKMKIVYIFGKHFILSELSHIDFGDKYVLPTDEEMTEIIIKRFNISSNDYTFHYGGSNLFVAVLPKLRGGKGGFGSMLRKIGSQIHKTTNKESCRDLNGRRLHNVNLEKRLREKLLKEKSEVKKEEEELKPLVFNHKFNDEEYEAQKETIKQSNADAISAGLEKSKKRRAIEEESVVAKKKNFFEMEEFVSDSDDEKKVTGQILLTNTFEITNSDLCVLECKPQDESYHDSHDLNNDIHIVTEVISVEPEKVIIGSDKMIPSIVEIPKNEHVEAFNFKNFDIENYTSPQKLANSIHMDVLKKLLQDKLLKCGGTALQRAERLFLVKDLDVENYPKTVLQSKQPTKN